MKLKLSIIRVIFLCIMLFCIFLKTPEYANAKNVTVTLPTFNVTMNDIKIDSTYRTYPFIVYKDITYFPMTWHDSRLLGLETGWSAQAGLEVNQTGITMNPNDYQIQTQKTKNKQTDQAIIAPFPIKVNGQIIQNISEPYPLLLYRDVTYFPITWRFGVDYFKWSYTFTNKNGLAIKSTADNMTVYERFLSLQLDTTTVADLERLFNKKLQVYIDVPEHMDPNIDMYYFDQYFLKVKKSTGRLDSKQFHGEPPAHLKIQQDANVELYLSIEKGMSYEQVKNLLGHPGFLFEETPYSLTYHWMYKHDLISATFSKMSASQLELGSKSLQIDRSPLNYPELKTNLFAYKNTNVTVENLDKLIQDAGYIEWPQHWKTYNEIVNVLGEGYLASLQYADNNPGRIDYLWVNQQANLIVEFTFYYSKDGELVSYMPVYTELTLK